MERRTHDASYAVVWRYRDDVASGGLWFLVDGFELRTRTPGLVIPFTRIAEASIKRDRTSRLRGLPVLALLLRDSTPVTIASLEGMGALRELASHVSRAVPCSVLVDPSRA